MRTLVLFLMTALAAFAADDAWAKVKALKTGQEVRVYKVGSHDPIAAQMDELTDDNLVVIIKKTQTAIPRAQIDRIDARPDGKSGPKIETTVKETTPDAKSASAAKTPASKPDVPGTTQATNISFGSKPDFEIVYRRAIGAPKK